MNFPPILSRDAPITASHAVKIEDVPTDYQSITTPIPLSLRIDGELAVERYARDQIGRQFVVGFNGSTAEIFIHKKHLSQIREFRLTKSIIPIRGGRMSHETTKPTLGKTKENCAPKKNGHWNWMDKMGQ